MKLAFELPAQQAEKLRAEAERLGLAPEAMEVFLILNGLDLHADVDKQEAVFLELAAGRSSRRELGVWLERHTAPSID